MLSVDDEGVALCDPFLAGLPVDGLSISVVTERGVQSTVGTTDLVARRLEELQFELNEGPSLDAVRTRGPVLANDLRGEGAQAVWSLFSPAAESIGARGVFCFPMSVGSVTVGVVSLHALVLLPPWSDGEVDAAIGLADAAARPAVELATRSAAAETRPADLRQIELHREVHQACGMLTVQLDCGIEEAMARLRAYAFAEDRPIDAVARDVVARRLDFADLD